MPEAVAAWAVNTLAVTGVTATVVSAAVYVATTVAISQVASALLAPSSGGGGTTSPQELSTTVRQAAASRRLLYGRSKAGGVLVYPAQSDDGKFAYLDVYLGEGPIHAIEPVFWLGDERSDDPKFDGLITLTPYLGTPGQAADAGLVAVSAGEWTSADVGTGIAHAVVRYEFDRNAFPRGLVLPSFEVLGRLVYDPRNGAFGYSNNPALCLLDYLRSEYGPDGGIADDLIDFASFATAANICDEVVVSIDPTNTVDGVAGRVRRYTLDGVFEVSAGHTAIVQTMLAAMGGAMPLVGGQYRLYVGAWRAPTGPQLTGEHLRADPTMRTHPGRTQRINTARGTYREPRQEWQTIDFHEQTLPAAVVAEAGEIVQNFSFPATTNGAIAQRLARLGMLQARSSVPLQLQCNWAAFEWQVFDVINVNLPEIGAVGTYLCVSYAYPEGGGIDLTLVPHNAADFAWEPATMEQLVPVVVRPDFNSTPPAVAGLAVGPVSMSGPDDGSGSGAVFGLSASWTATEDARLDHYEVQYKRNAAADWLVDRADGTYWARLLREGYYYDVRVRIVRGDGTTGPWAEVLNTLLNGDITPPGPPTALSVTGTGTHTIGWTNPITLDVMRARVYASATNDPATGVQVAEVFGLPATAYTATHTPAGVPTYYWVTAVDRSGNASARTAAGVGN
jgi:hypothetical protein